LETDIGKYQLTREIQILLSIEVPEIGTRATCDRQWRDLTLSRPGVEDMGAIEFEDFLATLRIGRDRVRKVGLGRVRGSFSALHAPNLANLAGFPPCHGEKEHGR
jgi:hypothetical protein